MQQQSPYLAPWQEEGTSAAVLGQHPALLGTTSCLSTTVKSVGSGGGRRAGGHFSERSMSRDDYGWYADALAPVKVAAGGTNGGYFVDRGVSRSMSRDDGALHVEAALGKFPRGMSGQFGERSIPRDDGCWYGKGGNGQFSERSASRDEGGVWGAGTGGSHFSEQHSLAHEEGAWPQRRRHRISAPARMTGYPGGPDANARQWDPAVSSGAPTPPMSARGAPPQVFQPPSRESTCDNPWPSSQPATSSRDQPPRRQVGEPKSWSQDAKWYRRPHVVDLEIEDVWFRGLQPVTASWYESMRYVVSLHAASSSPASSSMERPRGPPVGNADPSSVASKAKAAAPMPQPRASHEPSGEHGMGVRYQDSLALRCKQLGTHLTLYVWCQKTSVFTEENILLGCRAVPLRDGELNKLLATYDVCDDQDCEVAQVRLRCSLSSVPGPIQLPHLSDVEATSLQLNWSVPMEDRGKPILGYRIALFTPCSGEWKTVCECTKGTFFVLTDLAPSAVHLIDIRAVNEVGPGESTELEVATADEEGYSPGASPVSPLATTPTARSGLHHRDMGCSPPLFVQGPECEAQV